MPTSDAAALWLGEHRRALHRLASGLLGDSHAAEDVVQDVSVRLHAVPGWPDAVSDPSAYARKAITNACATRVRSMQRRAELLVPDVATAVPTAPRWSPQSGPAHDLELTLLAGIGALPERQRLAVVLRYAQDLNDAEVADVLNCSVLAVRLLRMRALRRLRNHISSKGDEVHE